MGSLLHQGSLIHHQDPIRAADRAEAVGDEEHRGTLKLFFEVEAHLSLGDVVEGAGGFIEDQQRGALEHSTGDGDALTLTTGEGTALLAHTAAVAVRQIHDEVVGAGHPGGMGDLLTGGFRAGEGDVVAHGAIEQQAVLGDDADLAAH